MAQLFPAERTSFSDPLTDDDQLQRPSKTHIEQVI